MKLSIIVPVYNMAGDNKLNYCMDSLVNQTISDYEIIAVDDCSTDNSLKILNNYQARYPDKIKVIASKINKKQGGAKNLGLEIARGEWIGFIDSDDWIAYDMYEKLLTKASETNADMVGCDYHLTSEHSMKIGQIVHNNKIEQTGILNKEKYRLLLLDSGSLVVKIYKRDIILGVDSRFPENIFYEDNAIFHTWMLRAKRFEYIQEPLYYYLQHSNSTVHTITKELCNHRMIAGRVMMEEAKRLGYYEEYKEEIDSNFIKLFYVNTLFSLLQSKESGQCKFIRKLGKEMIETLPDFRGNKYYNNIVDKEERKLIDMHMKSTIYMYLYYKALWLYRNTRKKLGE